MVDDLKITRVWHDDAMCTSDGRNIAITVVFENDDDIIFYLDTKINEPLFSDVVMDRCGVPLTDGKRVYWENGASLSIAEMMELKEIEPEEE